MSNIEVGATVEDFRDLPIGTLIQTSEGTLALREHHGLAMPSGTFYHPNGTDGRGWTIQSLGESEQPETLARFQQRFATTAIGCARVNSIALVPVREALRQMGVPREFTRSPGMKVHVADSDLLDSLPSGTILRFGTDEDWRLQSYLTRRDGGGVTGLLGGYVLNRNELLTVVSIPGTPAEEWVTREAAEQDAAEIEQFMERAYELGERFKRENDWCGQYEVAMSRVGITSDYINRPKAMTSDRIVSLRDGLAIFVNPDSPSDMAAYRRVGDQWVHQWGTGRPAEGPAVSAKRGESGLFDVPASLADRLPVGSVTLSTHDGLTRVHREAGWRAGWGEGNDAPHPRSGRMVTIVHAGGGEGVRVRTAVPFREVRVGEVFSSEGGLFVKDCSLTARPVGDEDTTRFGGYVEVRIMGTSAAAMVPTLEIMESLPEGSRIFYSENTWVRRGGRWVDEQSDGTVQSSGFRYGVGDGGVWLLGAGA